MMIHMMHASLGWLLLLFFQEGQAARFAHLTAAQGLSQSSVHSLALDQTGFLWLGTTHGLNRYDGRSVVVLRHNPNDPSSILSNQITALMADSGGGLWVGTDRGLSWSRGDEPLRRSFQAIDLGERPLAIARIYEDPQQRVWVGTTRGLFMAQSGDAAFQPIPGNNPDDMLVTALAWFQDRLWIGTRRNLFYLDEDVQWKALPVAGRASTRITQLRAESKHLWVATDLGVIQMAANCKDFTWLIRPESMAHGFVTDLTVAQDRLWLGTPKGLHRWDLTTQQMVVIQHVAGQPDSLGANFVWDLQVDRDGALWVATSPGGANRLIQDRPLFDVVREESDPTTLLQDSFVMAASQREEVLWVGTRHDGLRRIQGDVSERVWPAAGGRTVTAIVESRDGERLWFGSVSGLFGLNVAQPGEIHAFEEVQTAVYALEEAASGALWIGTTSGLDLFDADRRHLSHVSGIDDPVSEVTTARDGGAWVGTKGQVLHVAQSNTTPWQLRVVASQADNWFHAIVEDRKGDLWLGGDHGLWMIAEDGNHLRQLNGELGIDDLWVASLLVDDRDRLWIGSLNGLIRFDPEAGSKRVFGPLDGLEGLEFTPGASSRAAASRFLFGGVNGLCIFDPADFDHQSQPVAAVLTDVALFHQSIADQGDHWQPDPDGRVSLVLDHGQNNLSFSFTAVDLGFQGRNPFRYQLLGHDPDWQEVGVHNLAHYSRLGPGDYRFVVSTANRDGIWSRAPATLDIHIASPVWAMLWFRVAVLLTVAALAVNWLRSRRLARRRIQEAAAETKRKAAADFHDHLGHQLTRMSMLSSLAKNQSHDPDKLKLRLHQIQSTSQRLYFESRDFITSLLPGEHRLSDLALHLRDFGDELFDSSNMTFSFEHRPEELGNYLLSSDQRRQLSLIAKEALHNCLRHSGAARVILHLGVQVSDIVMVVEDDGTGLAPEYAPGQGLKNMHERACTVGGRLELETVGEGMRVVLRCPLDGRVGA